MASIQKRGKNYRITVSRGYDIHGKKLIETTTYKPDPRLTERQQEKAASLFAMEFELRVQNGYAMEGRKTTLQEFSKRWMDEWAVPNLQPGTVAKYQEELDDKILPALGHLKLTEIKPQRINAFFYSMQKDGCRRDGKPGSYSIGSIRKTRNVLSSIFRTAVSWELLESNPCKKATILAIPNTAEKIKYFTPAQAIAFLEYIEQPHFWHTQGHQRVDDTGIPYAVESYTSKRSLSLQMIILFQMALYTGARKGELLALKWSDVNGTAISICKAVSVVHGKLIVKEPKTRTSFRTITIPEHLAENLQRLRQEQQKFRLRVGDYWTEEGWIFTQDNGHMMSYSTPYHALQRVIIQYNTEHSEQLPLIPFHGLRHTSATLLISEHQNIKTVSNRLGHAQTSTTMNIYAHALRDSDQCASDALENLLEKHDEQ